MTLSAPEIDPDIPGEGGSHDRPLHIVGITLATCLIFCIFALSDSGWGPVLAPLSTQLHIPLATAGLLYVLWTAGYLPGALIGGTLLDRYGPRLVLFGAAIAIFIGILSVCLGIFLPHIFSVGLLLVLLVLAGSGGGTIDATSNGLISAIFAEKRGSALNLFNLLYPFSGVVIALVDAWLLTVFSNNPLPSFLFTLCFIVASMFSLLAIPRNYRLVHNIKPQEMQTKPAPSGQLSFFVLLAPVIIVMMLTSGTNSALRTWAAPYLHVVFAQTPGIAAALSGITLIFSMLSRLVAAWFILRLGSWRIAMICILVTLLGFALLLFSPNALIATFAIALATIGLSPLFATCITIGCERVPNSPGRVSGVLLFASGCCSVLFNWLFGFVLNNIGSNWAILFFLTVVIIGGLAAFRLHPHHQTA